MADRPEDKNVCSGCIEEAYLSAEVRREGGRDECAYCGRVEECLSVEALASLVEGAFERHFRRTDEDPDGLEWALTNDPEIDYRWEREGESVVDAIGMAVECSEEVAKDLQATLSDRHYDRHKAKVGEEAEFADDSSYAEKGADDFEWRAEWRWFENSLKTRARYFSSTAATLLEETFAALERLSTDDGSPLVVEVGPGQPVSDVWRARVFQSQEELTAGLERPNVEIGPPPARKARAGRMNAEGISVFYGAKDPDVAIAEVRPPVASHVVVARFDITRGLRLLDLTALGAVQESGSYFDPDFASLMEHAAFLRTLSQRISQPVVPYDTALDYLPTQAIADFLATVRIPTIDGIAYPSSQALEDPVNIVLFHHACRVDEVNVTAGTKIAARASEDSETGEVVGFDVIETVPVAARGEGDSPSADQEGIVRFESSADAWIDDRLSPADPDARDPALKLDVHSIMVRVVRGATYETKERPVRRLTVADRPAIPSGTPTPPDL